MFALTEAVLEVLCWACIYCTSLCELDTTSLIGELCKANKLRIASWCHYVATCQQIQAFLTTRVVLRRRIVLVGTELSLRRGVATSRDRTHAWDNNWLELVQSLKLLLHLLPRARPCTCWWRRRRLDKARHFLESGGLPTILSILEMLHQPYLFLIYLVKISLI